MKDWNSIYLKCLFSLICIESFIIHTEIESLGMYEMGKSDSSGSKTFALHMLTLVQFQCSKPDLLGTETGIISDNPWLWTKTHQHLGIMNELEYKTKRWLSHKYSYLKCISYKCIWRTVIIYKQKIKQFWLLGLVSKMKQTGNSKTNKNHSISPLTFYPFRC